MCNASLTEVAQHADRISDSYRQLILGTLCLYLPHDLPNDPILGAAVHIVSMARGAKLVHLAACGVTHANANQEEVEVAKPWILE